MRELLIIGMGAWLTVRAIGPFTPALAPRRPPAAVGIRPWR